MTPHQVKEGYLSLPAKAKRQFVLWAVEREFSGNHFAGLETQQIASVQAALTHGNHSGGVSMDKSSNSSIILKVIGVAVVLLILWFGGKFLYSDVEKASSDAAQKEILGQAQEGQKLAAKLEAEEAARPSSPTNLEYLTERIGKEVTLRGVPMKSEVGYLYFHKDPTLGARVKLISGGVVVYQSTELEKWVKDKQELEVRGTLIRTEEEGLLEIPIDRQIQIKLVEQE